MAIVPATRFTPEVLLSAPRRSAAAPNPSGELILYTISSYSFESHSRASQIRVQSLINGTSYVVSDDISANEPVWISDSHIVYVKLSDRGCTRLMCQDVTAPSSEPSLIYYSAGTLSSIKVKILGSGKVAFCCSAITTPSGEMYWEAAEPKTHSSAKLYDSIMVRHWDTWLTKNKPSLWYGLLVLKDGAYTLEHPGLTNLLAGTPLSCPVPPFGGTGDFDVSSRGIAFVAKDPDLNPARYTKTDLYFAPLGSFVDKPPEPPKIVKTAELRGYSMAPSFSQDGRKLAFVKMRNVQYESDKTRLMLVPDVDNLDDVQEFYESPDGNGGWDLRPDRMLWSNDGRELYVSADRYGRTVLWKLPASPRYATDLPQPIHDDGSVIEARPLGTLNSLLVSRRSRVESSSFCILDPNTKTVTEISSNSGNGKSLGLHKKQCMDIWFRGAGSSDIHALVTRPSDFDSSKKYPLALLVHGGPQSAWLDDWSTRWNPAIFAEQGYVVVAPNITGSTGYGQAHVDAIAQNWGGAPYEDLVCCYKYIAEAMPYVDIDRAVALGGSYGGFMINWIQGQDLGRKFKALVCHDGVYSTKNLYQTEELFFCEHDMGGRPWDNPEGYDKWDPSNFTHNWTTPELVIHSELDYRLCISEALAAFNCLQARKVPSKLLVFPDENHWVLQAENSLVWHQTVLDWINKYAGVVRENS